MASVKQVAFLKRLSSQAMADGGLGIPASVELEPLTNEQVQEWLKFLWNQVAATDRQKNLICQVLGGRDQLPDVVVTAIAGLRKDDASRLIDTLLRRRVYSHTQADLVHEFQQEIRWQSEEARRRDEQNLPMIFLSDRDFDDLLGA